MSNPDPSDAVDDDSKDAGHADTAADGDTESGSDGPTDVAALESRVEELTARVDEDVEDLRERLVRTYRDVEGKAEADHDHPETADRIDTLEADLDALDDIEETTTRLEADLDALADRTEALANDVADAAESAADAEERVDDLGARVEELADANDDAMDKLSRVASAVVRTQRRMRAIEHDRSERERLDEILAEANRHGLRTAECDGCGNGVRLSLLSKPECPYCESRIDAIDPGRRFIGTTWLRVDDTPALEGAVAATADGGETGDGAPSREKTNREPTDEGMDDREDPAGADVSTRDAGTDDSSDADIGDVR